MHFSTLAAMLMALLFGLGALVYQTPSAYVPLHSYLEAHGKY